MAKSYLSLPNKSPAKERVSRMKKVRLASSLIQTLKKKGMKQGRLQTWKRKGKEIAQDSMVLKTRPSFAHLCN
jgi:hypothetical protein